MASTKRLPMPLLDSYEWQYQGACTAADPFRFSAPVAAGGARRGLRAPTAKSYCERCPVVQECLNHALAVRESHGVWGGLNTDERRALLGGQQIAS